jgi:hypothetical protein
VGVVSLSLNVLNRWTFADWNNLRESFEKR